MNNNIFNFLPEPPIGKVLNILEGVDDFIAKHRQYILYPTGKTPFLHFRKYLIQHIELLNKNREKSKLPPLKFSELNKGLNDNHNRQMNFVKLAVEKDIKQQEDDASKIYMKNLADGVNILEAKNISKLPTAPKGNLPKSKTSELTSERKKEFLRIPTISQEQIMQRENELFDELEELEDYNEKEKGGKKKKKQSAKKKKKQSIKKKKTNVKKSKKIRKEKRHSKKHKTLKIRYVQKGAGNCVSRSQNTPQSTISTPEIIMLNNGENLPVASATLENPSIATVNTNISSLNRPVLNAYSQERIFTVNAIMNIFGFNELEKEKKEELKLALLNYLRHGKHFQPVYAITPIKNVDSVIDEINHFVPGELHILVSDWNEWRKENEMDINEAINDLIYALKTPKDEDIMFDYGYH
tara:strand:- start:666 stop:1898 length:1233 start_codon:yes stop_codon:yes gene_type:complete